jgi:lysozyme
MKKIFFLVAGIFVAISIIGVILIYRILFIPGGIDIDKSRYPVTGIDVSEHTGKIDFRKIRAQNIDFAYLKASEGETYVDKKFEINYTNAKQNDMPVGAYHFFRFNVNGKKQAVNFLRAIRGKDLELPPVLDVEEWGNFSAASPEYIITELRAFIKEVEDKQGKPVMLYTNESGYVKFVNGNFKGNQIWICSFSNSPKVNCEWTLWQHSHKGELEGAEGWVDMNTFNGTKSEWWRDIKNR